MNPTQREDSPAYKAKKTQLSRILTIFGRKPVAEALSLPLKPFRLHLASSNKSSAELDALIAQATQKGADVCYHSREALSRISKNARQDQGVALDLECQGFQRLDDFLTEAPPDFELLALDNVTNPQNLGMIIRSVCASPMTALLLPDKGCAPLDALVIKASAGTLFKARILRCPNLAEALAELKRRGADCYSLAANGRHSLHQLPFSGRQVYVMGNETSGVSAEVDRLCNARLGIPLCNGVESLNVSVAASLVAFRRCYFPPP
jgi:23S rRNA (guanosine2251-2'-O)-methyltransferase